LSKRYQRRSLSNDQFRQFVAGWLPPKSPDPQLESFFDQWVYTTGIPKLKLHYSTRGAAPSVRVSGTITQTDVDDDFTAYVPVEIEIAGGKPIIQWVRTSSEPASFTVVLSQAPGKVLLDPGNSVLRR
jgi:aminopeptidase N